MPRKNFYHTLIYIAVFVSGFSFLIYEVAWNRYLSQMLGTTVFASTIVLMSFMAGMGAGAFFISKFLGRFKNLPKIFAGTISLVGIFNLINIYSISIVKNLLYGSFQNYLLTDFLFFATVFVLFFIPTFFMGGLIPLASKLLIAQNKQVASRLGKIYALETLGSTLGGLLTGFVLLGTLGQTQTLIFAVTINFLTAVSIFFLKNSPQIQLENKKIKQKNISANSENSKTIALPAIFIAGFGALALQVAWIRIFKTYFTNTSYTFTLISALAILGLSLGSWLYQKREAKIKNNDIVMLRMLILFVVLALWSLIILYKLPEILMFPFDELMKNPVARILLLPVLSSILIVLPVSAVSGFMFPLAGTMMFSKIKNIDKSVGKVLMTNTLGAVASPAITTFLLINFLGSGRTIIAIAILIALVALFVAFKIKSYKKISVYKNALIGINSVLILIFVLSGTIKILPPSVKKQDKQILSYSESVEGTIIVAQDNQQSFFGKSTFVNNSAVIGSSYDAVKAVKMIGHIPFFAGLEAENVLIIGFGIGVTTSAIASHESVKKIDCVELLPDLKNLAFNYQDFNFQIYNDKRLNMISGDGRHFLQITANKYDLISCDPTHPVLGSGNLYTQEYFEQAYAHLNDGGMLSQYLPLHKLEKSDLLGIIKTFNSVFENSSVWLGQYHAILIGKKGECKIDFKTWEEKVLAQPKDKFFYLEPYHIAASVVWDSEKIKQMTSNEKINTDNQTYTEFFSFKSFSEENIYQNLQFLTENRCDINSVFDNIDNQMKIDRFVDGNKKLTESLYFMLKGDKKSSLESLRKAVTVNPDNEEYPFLIKFYFGEER